jgi:hypothetical protein
MSYRRCVVKGGSAAILVFAFVVVASCGGTTSPTSTTPTGAAATAATGGAASGGPVAGAPSFGQILSSAKAIEYKVTYKLTATGGAAGFSGEQSWFFKPPKARFDFSSSASGQTSTVSLFSLPDGTFMCFGTGPTAQCIGMTGLDTALQQNPAAFYQESLIQHPDQWSGVLVETRQIAGQQAHCYDVKPLTATAGLTDGRFCYSTQGVPLLQRFAASGGTWSMEATSLSTTVPDSDFTLPSTPTILGRP